MAAYQKNYQEQAERVAVPVLKLTSEDIAGLAASTQREGFLPFDEGEIAMIADLCPNALLPDVKRFIYRASGLQLNPLYNEIHMEYKYSKGQPKATFVIHIDGYRKIANASGQFGGFKQVTGDDIQGKYIDTTIWRKDAPHPFEARVYFAEWEGDLYQKKPYHMVAKCGAAFCYKIAFPVSGLTSEDENDAWSDPGRGAEPEQQRQAASAYTVTEMKLTTPEQAGGRVPPVPMPPPPPVQPTPQPTATAEPPRPVPGTPPLIDVEAEKQALKAEWKDIAGRLTAIGVTKADFDFYYAGYYMQRGIEKPTPLQTVEALRNAEAWIKENGSDEFFAKVRPEPNSADAWAADPAVKAALADVRATFPAWSPGLCKVAALWCSDQLREANQLDAFLINSGLNAQTAPGKLEAFLAITRHMVVSAGPSVVKYAEVNDVPFSALEFDLSKIVAMDIRFSPDVPRNAVTQAFQSLAQRGKAA